MARFDAVQAHLLDSLEAEGTMLDSLKALSASAQRQALALEAALSVHQQDAALIASLRTRLAEAAGMVEAAAARERGAQEELSRERLALTAAAQRVEELAAQAEGLRQMIAAAPRPPRPQLSGAVQGGASDTPFERWRANAGLLRLEGVPRGRRRSLSPGTVRRLGHVTAVCAGGCGGACEGGCGGGGGGHGAAWRGPHRAGAAPILEPAAVRGEKGAGCRHGWGRERRRLRGAAAPYLRGAAAAASTAPAAAATCTPPHFPRLKPRTARGRGRTKVGRDAAGGARAACRHARRRARPGGKGAAAARGQRRLARAAAHRGLQWVREGRKPHRVNTLFAGGRGGGAKVQK